MLTGNEIIIQQQSGGLRIEPFDPDCVGANSYDVHLAPELMVYTETILDAKHPNRTERLTIPEDGLVLWPHRLYLGRTVEYTETDRFVPMYEGRSSLGRLGVFSHVTAGFGDIGFKGNWTLEIMVIHPIRVYPGMRIGQLFYHKPDGAVVKRYDSEKYQGQTDVMPSKLFMDFVRGGV